MRKTNLLLTVLLVMSFVLLHFAPTSSALAADGTTGAIKPGNDFYYENSGITLKLTGLTGGADYALNITAGVWPGVDTNNQYAFTTGASETSKRLTLDDCRSPTSGSKATIILVYASAGTEIDRTELLARTAAGGLPTGLIIAIGIAVLIFSLIFKIISGVGN